jgi:hypothetical protein
MTHNRIVPSICSERSGQRASDLRFRARKMISKRIGESSELHFAPRSPGCQPLPDSSEQVVRVPPDFSPDSALPDGQNPPPGSGQHQPVSRVILRVPVDLRSPEKSIRPRPLKEVALVLVPQAAVNKDNCAKLWKHEIGRPRQVPSMKPVSETKREETLADQSLRFSVFAPDAGHAIVALRGRKDIRHGFNF